MVDRNIILLFKMNKLTDAEELEAILATQDLLRFHGQEICSNSKPVEVTFKHGASVLHFKFLVNFKSMHYFKVECCVY